MTVPHSAADISPNAFHNGDREATTPPATSVATEVRSVDNGTMLVPVTEALPACCACADNRYESEGKAATSSNFDGRGLAIFLKSVYMKRFRVLKGAWLT